MKIVLGAIAGCAALAAVGAAVANSGLYLGGGVGLRGTVGELRYVGLANQLRPKFDEGPMYIVNLGYRAPIGIRAELEMGYGSNFADKKTTPAYSGKLEQWQGIASLYYDLPVTDWLSITVGGGGGYVKTLGQIRSVGVNYLHGHGYSSVWHATGGINVALNDQLELYADYRYQQYGASQHGSDFTAFNPVRLVDAHSHIFMVGFRWFPQPIYL
jgi:opacity protein-like surface antigen